MRSKILLSCAVLLAIAVGAPRAGHCCRLGGRAGAGSSLIVSVTAARAEARPSPFRELAKLETPARFDPRLLVPVLPTFATIAGRTHAGFAISGRF